MPTPRRYLNLLLLSIVFALSTLLLRFLSTNTSTPITASSSSASLLQPPSWRSITQAVGLGDYFFGEDDLAFAELLGPSGNSLPAYNATPIYVSGQAKPLGSNYTRWLVIARTKAENATWIKDEGLLDGGFVTEAKIYVADDPKAPLHPPRNKGREVMIYLTFIIDHYDSLPDVTIFMHAHRYSWHNNDLLNNDAVEMVRRLSAERVIREGYMNLRSHWPPGCPEWMHPGRISEDKQRPEEMLMAKAWSEIFPGRPVPSVLAGACCAQFAVSADRIRVIKRERYIQFRDWVLQTKIRDTMSGRIWEYLWHVVFTGEEVWCPDQHTSYCDGYGLCFEDSNAFEKWFEIRSQKRAIEEQLKMAEGKKEDEVGWLRLQEEVDMKANVKEIERNMDLYRDAALERGRDPRIRARIAGRVWRDGDGF